MKKATARFPSTAPPRHPNRKLKAPTPRFTPQPPIREEPAPPPGQDLDEPRWEDFTPRWWPGEAPGVE